jgi:hypothetical protein
MSDVQLYTGGFKAMDEAVPWFGAILLAVQALWILVAKSLKPAVEKVADIRPAGTMIFAGALAAASPLVVGYLRGDGTLDGPALTIVMPVGYVFLAFGLGRLGRRWSAAGERPSVWRMALPPALVAALLYFTPPLLDAIMPPPVPLPPNVIGSSGPEFTNGISTAMWVAALVLLVSAVVVFRRCRRKSEPGRGALMRALPFVLGAVALFSFPFLQIAMQGEIPTGNLTKIRINDLQIEVAPEAKVPKGN